MFNTDATSYVARDHTITRSPFTPRQWQELKHQALIFKYMVSGVPIPPELIYSINRSLDSSLASTLFPTQHVGWGFQVGFGRKTDPEPGRCRRTDGKKWRCSKKAYPDSRYCERHMLKGRNISRKPVETLTNSSSVTTISPSSIANNPSSISSLNRKLSINSPSSSISSTYSFSPLSSSISPEVYAHHQDPYQKSSNHLNTFLYSHSSSSSIPPGSYALSTHDNMTPHHFLDSESSSSYNFHGIREGVIAERAFFPEASRSLGSFQASCHPSYVSYNKAYSHHSHFQSFSDSSKQQQEQQHCFVLGTDFKSTAATTRPLKAEKEDETQKPLHHFPLLDLSSNFRTHSGS